MKLQNLKLAGMNLMIGKDLIQVDASGVVSVEDQDVADSLIASGFAVIEQGKGKAKKREEVLFEKVAPEGAPMEQVAPPPEAAKEEPKEEKKRWSRSNP